MKDISNREKYVSFNDVCEELNQPHEDQLHLTKLTVNAGGTIYTIDANGLKVAHGEAPTGRGTSIVTEYQSETGDTFERQEQFHKGQVKSEIRQVNAGQPGNYRDIWRD
ncbi:hypothetical protein HNR44_001556 [Geomicrobium halophilum]|uniref:Uncharacterized protein n=1 Tax=Geomicrobium halophilum TaxID=549000 RepID=A0A841PL75_9BACL|nr:hypothetical protein [Geomicrobium halophilum]MBB6449607.1 hypothetical protein [Geomicrobium halophilum]